MMKQTELPRFDNEKESDWVLASKGIFDYFEPSDKVIVDVGAGAGAWAIWSVYRGAKEVHAIEPSMKKVNRLRRMIVDNAMQTKLYIYNTALGNGARIAGYWDNNDFISNGDYSSSIACQKFDDLGILPDIVRMNVGEGTLEALKGMERTIVNNSPNLVMIYPNHEIEEKVEKEFLNGHGYMTDKPKINLNDKSIIVSYSKARIKKGKS